ncbi:Hemolysin activation/secretion protein [Rhodoferax sp. OV413]|nr:Hemolysin activation/secretion protein [Rhodoferax sp. OV413]
MKAVRAHTLAAVLWGLLAPALAQTPLDQVDTRASLMPPSLEKKIPVRQIHVTGATLFPAATLEALVSPLNGSEHTLTELNRAVERINAFYGANGWTLARAYLPPQAIQNGELEVRVAEGALSEIRIDNQSRLRTDVLEARLAHIQRNAPINMYQLDRAVLLLSDLPGIESQAELAPGSATGLTELHLNAQNSPLLTGRLESDNHGSQYLGRVRYGGKFALNNPFGYGEQFGLHLLSSQSALFFGHLSAQMPLGIDGLTLGASIIRTQYRLGSDFAQLDATGSVKAATVRASYALVRSPELNLVGQISAESRALQDKVNATQTTIDKHAQHWSLDLTLSQLDRLDGSNLLALQLGTGNLRLDSDVSRAIDAASAQTAGRYSTLGLELQRTQRLTPQWEAYLRLHGQLASQNLDSYDKLAIGGPGGVRAYPSGEATGDQGWLSQVELRYAITPMFIPSVFWDTGSVRISKSPFLSGANHRRLEGAGLGLRGSYKAVDWQAWLAWPRTGPAQSEHDKSPRAWIQGRWAF